MQRLGVHEQATLDLAVATRPQSFALEGEVTRQLRAKRLARARGGLVLRRQRVLAEPDAGEQILGQRSCLAQIERRDRTERKLTLLAADAVLDDPGARAAGAHTHAEARHVVVEKNLIGHTRRQGERSNGCCSQLHQESNRLAAVLLVVKPWALGRRSTADSTLPLAPTLIIALGSLGRPWVGGRCRVLRPTAWPDW